MPTRRTFLINTAAAAGAATFLPALGHAAGHGASYSFAGGSVVIHPIAHASFVMETPAGVVYVDTVGEAAQYEGMPNPDLILITHRHGDHYNADLLAALPEAPILTNADVRDMMPGDLQARTEVIAAGQEHAALGLGIGAIPSYNVTEGRLNFHPQDRGDLGFVITIGDFRVYVSGDTEATPEMMALTDIDLAFVCMNLPFTMTAEQAAAGVAAFSPGVVIPYHYRGREGGTQDPKEFARLLAASGASSEVTMHDWYNGSLG